MATRRPKVPKVTPSRPAPETSDGADNTASGTRPAQAATKAPAGSSKIQPGRPGLAGKTPGSKAPASSRAAAATSADRDADHQPVPAKAFSGRMLALAVVMVAITILLAPTVKIFFDKKAELDALNADIAARQAEGKALRQQVSRWQDPNYVKQQARDRINMVMPGETGYWVFGGDEPAGESSSEPGAATPDPADLPWVDSLWESITRAATD
ncbi:septation ring formation regulator EzrA [Arthrobacter sp. ZBG10]|uniref:FtsB family cell division protein n=1 Tax=Arthrobacter sp. ZBG10 TaxID=1676590 RepID=UPI00068010FE|nr:septum formation initiator family protein [Arthrobacter sp. ZBG10]KNH18575.1 septation ring formation regulator EzrA [Arthrobacter sp. ZBG10]